MATMSYLIQKTTNGTLDLIKQASKKNSPLPNDLALSRQLGVSRTSVRTVVDHLCSTGVLARDGVEKKILRAPKGTDYFDISNQPSSKEEQIEKYFLEQINTAKLKPGERFSELDLANKSGCTTITVREFLIRFAHTGLINKKPRAQWQMVEFTESLAKELVEIRKILEMSAVSALLKRSNDDPVWHELEQLLNEHITLQKNIDKRYTELPELDTRLHLALQSSTNNRFTTQFFDTVIFVCYYHYQWDRCDVKERNAIAVQEHIDLLKQLLMRDMRGTILSLEAHLNTVQKVLMRSVLGLVG